MYVVHVPLLRLKHQRKWISKSNTSTTQITISLSAYDPFRDTGEDDQMKSYVRKLATYHLIYQ